MMKILVVDDNYFLASTIQAVLEDEGYEVMSATDGINGYSAYLFFEPDLVITDIHMPGENGLEMMERVRTHNPMIRTIYMSGDIRSFREALLEEEKKYPVCFFEKPFPLESLMQFLSGPTADPCREKQIGHSEMARSNKGDAAARGNARGYRKRMASQR
jgi:CheY-like chemotaxis protein